MIAPETHLTHWSSYDHGDDRSHPGKEFTLCSLELLAIIYKVNNGVILLCKPTKGPFKCYILLRGWEGGCSAKAI